MKTNATSHNHLDSLVLLRGLAAVMVCCCHLGSPLITGNPLAPLFAGFSEYGKYGVQVFFVISGFVIPLSLLRGNYTLTNYSQFLYKRLLRLQPPYLAALLVTLIIMFLSSQVKHTAFSETASSILASLFYLHIPADNPVFWSLAVEAEYYLFIGVAYLVMVYYPRLFLCGLTPTLLLVSYLSRDAVHALLDYSLLESIGYFLVGMIGFLVYAQIGKRMLTYGSLGATLLFLAATTPLPAFGAALFTIGVILFYRVRISNFWLFPGKISYSLYLLHFPIGIKLINLTKAQIDPQYSWLLFLSALGLSVVVAWVLYKLVEEFSEQISRRIKYTRYASTQRIEMA